MDVLICREDVYQEYKKQDGFQETIDFPEDNMLKKKKIILMMMRMRLSW